MNLTQFSINKIAFSHVITTGDTMTLTLTNVSENIPKTVTPVIVTIGSTFFTCEITSVVDASLQDLPAGDVYLKNSGYYNYQLKKNGNIIESSQVFVNPPEDSVVVNNSQNTVTITTFGAGSSGSSGASGTNGISGTNGSSGLTGSSGSSGQNGIAGTSGINGQTGAGGTSGSSGANGLGAKSKAGSIPITGFTYNATTTNYEYDVVFAEAYANTNYSVSINLVDTNINNIQDPYNYYPTWTSEKSVSGFTINTLGDPATYPTVIVEWMAISQGETGVAVAGSSGSSGQTGPTGSSGSSGLTGTSGTSAPGANGTSGINGTSGQNGLAGQAGTSGTSAGGGGASTLVTGVTLSSASWSYNAPYYEYTYSNASITTSTVVDFTPYNASVAECIISAVYPYVQVSAGSCKFYADNAPTTNITGDVLITTTI